MCGEGRAVSSWGRGRGGKGRERGGHPDGGQEGVFSPAPGIAAREEAGGKLGPRLARGIDDSAGGHGHLGGGSGGGRRSAPMSWMGSEGLAGGGRQCSGSFWRLGGTGWSCGARLADRHFTSSREGGGSRGDGFLQGKKTRPREEGGEAQISCRRGLAGGRAAERAGPGADAAGPSQVTPRLRAWPGGGARGGGARARAPAYKRAAQALPPDRAARAAAPPPFPLCCSVCAWPPKAVYSRSALLSFAKGWRIWCSGISHRDVFLPPFSFPPALIDPSLVSSLAPQAASWTRACTCKDLSALGDLLPLLPPLLPPPAESRIKSLSEKCSAKEKRPSKSPR